MFRTLCVLGLLLVLVHAGAPPASADIGRESERLSVNGFLSILWEALDGILPGPGEGEGGASTEGGTEGGPYMDPNGGPPRP